jgi:hypothetical protein
LDHIFISYIGGANFSTFKKKSSQAYVFTKFKWGDINMDFSSFILDIPNYRDGKNDIIMWKA